MPKFVTPARLAAALGVVTGLSAAATSLLNVVPKESTVGRAVVGGVGVLGSIATVIKWLDGQSKWELQVAEHAHYAGLHALARHQDTIQTPEPLEAAELEGETPLDVTAEPERLQDQVQA